MEGTITVEGLASALLYFLVIFLFGTVLWVQSRFRFTIVLIWLSNLADVFAQFILSHNNMFAPEFWAINYGVVLLFLIAEYRRNGAVLTQYSAFIYGGLLILAAGLVWCNLVEYKEFAKRLLTMTHILHWGIGALLTAEAIGSLYRRYVR